MEALDVPGTAAAGTTHASRSNTDWTLVVHKLLRMRASGKGHDQNLQPPPGVHTAKGTQKVCAGTANHYQQPCKRSSQDPRSVAACEDQGGAYVSAHTQGSGHQLMLPEPAARHRLMVAPGTLLPAAG